MSIQVPNDQALSLEHRQYLEMLGQNDKVTYLDQQFPPDDVMLQEIAEWRAGLPPSDLRPVATVGNPGQINLADVSSEDLLAELDRRTEATDDEDDGTPYEQWTAAELRTEAGGRKPPLSTAGTKAELIARLEENDRSQPPL